MLEEAARYYNNLRDQTSREAALFHTLRLYEVDRDDLLACAQRMRWGSECVS